MFSTTCARRKLWLDRQISSWSEAQQSWRNRLNEWHWNHNMFGGFYRGQQPAVLKFSDWKLSSIQKHQTQESYWCSFGVWIQPILSLMFFACDFWWQHVGGTECLLQLHAKSLNCPCVVNNDACFTQTCKSWWKKSLPVCPITWITLHTSRLVLCKWPENVSSKSRLHDTGENNLQYL